MIYVSREHAASIGKSRCYAAISNQTMSFSRQKVKVLYDKSNILVNYNNLGIKRYISLHRCLHSSRNRSIIKAQHGLYKVKNSR
jgi:hypothetical protein